jgi:hypothetical protein
MKEKTEKSKFEPDSCSLLIFIDEGRMFHQLIDQQKRFPNAASILMLTALPFCALTAHDSLRFAKKFTPEPVPMDSAAVSRLRNYSKSLSDKGMSVKEYAETVEKIHATHSSEMKSHTGLFANVLNAIQPDVGIHYYDGMPILTTYVTARYIGIDGTSDPEVIQQLGFDIGCAAALNFATADAIRMDPQAYESQEFKTTSRDYQYGLLRKPLEQKGLSYSACLPLLSEILVQINSVIALRKANIFSDPLFLKFGTAVLITANQSISKLCAYIGKDPEAFGCTTEGVTNLSGLIPRETRTAIKHVKKLRNALIHYDFPGLIGQEACEGKLAGEILNQGIRAIGFKDDLEYLDWLSNTMKSCGERITGFIELPRIDTRGNESY